MSAYTEANINQARSYWTSMLPATPMPFSIKHYRLPDDASFNASAKWRWGGNGPISINFKKCKHYPPGSYETKTETETKTVTALASLFILEKELREANKVHYIYDFPIHEEVGQSGSIMLKGEVRKFGFLALRSKNLPGILDRFSVGPKSVEAQVIKDTVHMCEYAWRDENICVSSLETMVEYAVSSLGVHNKARLRALSTTIVGLPSSPKQLFRVVRLKRIGEKNSAVTCHKAGYPYAVYICHKRCGTVPYMATLVGQRDGFKMEAATVCHMDTSEWDPDFPGLVVLNATPSTPACHFLNRVSVLWVAPFNVTSIF